MGRIHFVEIHDLESCPSILRELLTETLVWLWTQFPVPSQSMSRVLANVLARYVDANRTTEILDLCSGSGGPMPVVAALLGARGVTVTLSDLYPQTTRWSSLCARNPYLKFAANSVDATKVSRELCPTGTLRTFMGSFHHMTPELARKIFQDCIDSRNGIFIGEATERSALAIILLGVIGSLLLPVLFWFWMGMSWQRVIFTFLIPVLPLLLSFDGIVSCLRSYDRSELMELVHSCKNHEQLRWTFEEHRLVSVLPYPKLVVFSGAPM